MKNKKRYFIDIAYILLGVIIVVLMSMPKVIFAAEEKEDGWYMENGEWHYYVKEMNSDISAGWHMIDGEWYAFVGLPADEGTGRVMARDEWVEGYYVDNDGRFTYTAKGEWKQDEKGWYFIDSNGWYPKNEGQWINNFYYEFDEDGYMIADDWGLKKDTEEMYAYYDSEGHQVKRGMWEIDGKVYHFYTEGLGHKKYSFTLRNEVYTKEEGWNKVSDYTDDKYYIEDGKIIRSTWKQIDGYWYYFDYSGLPETNAWRTGYYLDEDGKQTYQYQAKWYYDSGKKMNYYQDESGWYATGKVMIDGAYAHFTDDGYTYDGPGAP